MTEQKLERISSGIVGLDEVVGGGFVQKQIIMLSGPAGSGKSVFALQYLMAGARKGEKGVLISLEKDPEKYREIARSFGWDLEKAEKEGSILIVKAGPIEIKNFVDHMNIELMEMLNRRDIKKAVIDSVTPFEILFKDIVKRRAMLAELIERLRETKCTSIITADVTVEQSSNGIFSTSGMLDYLVDGIIYIRYLLDEHRHEWTRELSVPKMLAQGVSNKVFPLIMTNKGLGVLSKRTVKNIGILNK